MRITKTQLQQIIKEEVSKILNMTPMERLEGVKKMIEDNDMTAYWVNRAKKLENSSDLTMAKVAEFSAEVRSHIEQEEENNPFGSY